MLKYSLSLWRSTDDIDDGVLITNLALRHSFCSTARDCQFLVDSAATSTVSNACRQTETALRCKLCGHGGYGGEASSGKLCTTLARHRMRVSGTSIDLLRAMSCFHPPCLVCRLLSTNYGSLIIIVIVQRGKLPDFRFPRCPEAPSAKRQASVSKLFQLSMRSADLVEFVIESCPMHDVSMCLISKPFQLSMSGEVG